MRSKVNFLWKEAVAKASLNRAIKLRRVDPKLSDLSMASAKLG